MDKKRSPIDDNDIPDLINRFRNLDGEADRERTEKSFLVPKDEIVSNDYDLSINKYKKVEYVQEKYPPTKQLIHELKELNKELEERLKILEGML